VGIFNSRDAYAELIIQDTISDLIWLFSIEDFQEKDDNNSTYKLDKKDHHTTIGFLAG
jgi:hypothetical protein